MVSQCLANIQWMMLMTLYLTTPLTFSQQSKLLLPSLMVTQLDNSLPFNKKFDMDENFYRNVSTNDSVRTPIISQTNIKNDSSIYIYDFEEADVKNVRNSPEIIFINPKKTKKGSKISDQLRNHLITVNHQIKNKSYGMDNIIKTPNDPEGSILRVSKNNNNLDQNVNLIRSINFEEAIITNKALEEAPLKDKEFILTARSAKIPLFRNSIRKKSGQKRKMLSSKSEKDSAVLTKMEILNHHIKHYLDNVILSPEENTLRMYQGKRYLENKKKNVKHKKNTNSKKVSFKKSNLNSDKNLTRHSYENNSFSPLQDNQIQKRVVNESTSSNTTSPTKTGNLTHMNQLVKRQSALRTGELSSSYRDLQGKNLLATANDTDKEIKNSQMFKHLLNDSNYGQRLLENDPQYRIQEWNQNDQRKIENFTVTPLLVPSEFTLGYKEGKMYNNILQLLKLFKPEDNFTESTNRKIDKTFMKTANKSNSTLLLKEDKNFINQIEQGLSSVPEKATFSLNESENRSGDENQTLSQLSKQKVQSQTRKIDKDLGKEIDLHTTNKSAAENNKKAKKEHKTSLNRDSKTSGGPKEVIEKNPSKKHNTLKLRTKGRKSNKTKSHVGKFNKNGKNITSISKHNRQQNGNVKLEKLLSKEDNKNVNNEIQKTKRKKNPRKKHRKEDDPDKMNEVKLQTKGRNSTKTEMKKTEFKAKNIRGGKHNEDEKRKETLEEKKKEVKEIAENKGKYVMIKEELNSNDTQQKNLNSSLKETDEKEIGNIENSKNEVTKKEYQMRTKAAKPKLKMKKKHRIKEVNEVVENVSSMRLNQTSNALKKSHKQTKGKIKKKITDKSIKLKKRKNKTVKTNKVIHNEYKQLGSSNIQTFGSSRQSDNIAKKQIMLNESGASNRQNITTFMKNIDQSNPRSTKELANVSRQNTLDKSNNWKNIDERESRMQTGKRQVDIKSMLNTDEIVLSEQNVKLSKLQEIDAQKIRFTRKLNELPDENNQLIMDRKLYNKTTERNNEKLFSHGERKTREISRFYTLLSGITIYPTESFNSSKLILMPKKEDFFEKLNSVENSNINHYNNFSFKPFLMELKLKPPMKTYNYSLSQASIIQKDKSFKNISVEKKRRNDLNQSKQGKNKIPRSNKKIPKGKKIPQKEIIERKVMGKPVPQNKKVKTLKKVEKKLNSKNNTKIVKRIKEEKISRKNGIKRKKAPSGDASAKFQRIGKGGQNKFDVGKRRNEMEKKTVTKTVKGFTDKKRKADKMKKMVSPKDVKSPENKMGKKKDFSGKVNTLNKKDTRKDTKSKNVKKTEDKTKKNEVKQVRKDSLKIPEKKAKDASKRAEEKNKRGKPDQSVNKKKQIATKNKKSLTKKQTFNKTGPAKAKSQPRKLDQSRKTVSKNKEKTDPSDKRVTESKGLDVKRRNEKKVNTKGKKLPKKDDRKKNKKNFKVGDPKTNPENITLKDILYNRPKNYKPKKIRKGN